MWPTCYDNDCSYWGPQKLNDSNVGSFSSLGIVQAAAYPYVQLDFGELRTDISAVRLVARADCCLDQSQGLNVYLSGNSTFLPPVGTLVSAGIAFTGVGQTVTITVPASIEARYLTVWKNHTWSYLSLQEVTALYDGGWLAVQRRWIIGSTSDAHLFLCMHDCWLSQRELGKTCMSGAFACCSRVV